MLFLTIRTCFSRNSLTFILSFLNTRRNIDPPKELFISFRINKLMFSILNNDASQRYTNHKKKLCNLIFSSKAHLSFRNYRKYYIF